MRWLGLAFSCACVGCTSTVPDFGIDLVPPSVIVSEPLAGSTGVDRHIVLRVVFSEPIESSTVTSESFQVLYDGVPLPGAIAATSTAATFTPSTALDDLVSYEIRVASSIKDLAGLELSAPLSAFFTTEDLQWEAPIAVTGTAGAFYGASAGVDENGNVMVVWSDDFGAWSRRIVGGVVQPMEQLSIGAIVRGSGVADDGTAMAIWTREVVPGRRDLFWSRWSPITGLWSAPDLVETDDTGSIGQARLSVNASGFAVAAWNQMDTFSPPYRPNLYARVYAPGSGWGSVDLLESRTESAEPPYVALGPDGNAVVSWVQSDGSFIRAWGSYYGPKDGWTTAAVLDTSGGVTAARSYLDGQANGLVVWGGVNRAFNRYVAGEGWSGPQAVGTGLSPIGNGIAAAVGESDGEGILAWNEQNDGSDDIWVTTLSAAGGVGIPLLVSSSQGSGAFAQECGLDFAGRGFVVFNQEVQNRRSLVVSRRSGDGSWSSPRLLENDDIGNAYSGPTDVGPGGQAAVLYSRDDGVKSQIWMTLLR